MRLEQPDRRGGRLDSTNGLRVQIDADRPTATITSFANNGHVQGTTGAPRTLIIGGNAADALSSIAKVEVKVGTGAWQRAEGSAAWSYALNVTQGSYDVRVRATDGAGNVGAPTLKTLIVDATAPTATVEGPGATSIPARDRSGQWRVVVRGTTSDPAVGAQSGSGVAPYTLKVSLQTGRGTGEGNGWPPATVTDGTWRLDYMLPTDLVDPTGTYTVALQVEDRVGNRFNNPASTVIRLDPTGPGAVMGATDAARPLISTPLTLGGPISDTTSLDKMEIRYTPITEVVALSGTVLLLPFEEPTNAVYFADRSTRQQDAVCSDAARCPTAGQAGLFDRGLTMATLCRGALACAHPRCCDAADRGQNHHHGVYRCVWGVQQRFTHLHRRRAALTGENVVVLHLWR